MTRLPTVDEISAWFEQLFAWAIVALTALGCFEVASRHAFNAPHAWAFGAWIMLYGILFVMGIQLVALALPHVFPAIGLRLPQALCE